MYVKGITLLFKLNHIIIFMNITNSIYSIAGFMVLLSLALSQLHSTNWLWFTAFIGLNLFQFGFTQFCPLKIILKKLGVKE